MLLQGRVLRGSADELSPESEERSGGSQPQHAGVYRDGQNPAGGQKPGIRRGEIGDGAVIINLMLEVDLLGKRKSLYRQHFCEEIPLFFRYLSSANVSCNFGQGTSFIKMSWIHV